MEKLGKQKPMEQGITHFVLEIFLKNPSSFLVDDLGAEDGVQSELNIFEAGDISIMINLRRHPPWS